MIKLSIFSNFCKSKWKKAFTGFCVLCYPFTFSVHAQVLVWQDNFDSTAVNGNRWTYDFGNGSDRAAGYGWGNSELQYYTSRPDNVRTENGSLLIEAKSESFQGSAFTSGRIKTEGRVHFKYGTVEARIKLPNLSNGLWPAFWTLGTVGPGWPSIGEIDIMEVGAAAALQAGLGNRQVSSAAHWSNASGTHQYNVSHTNAAVDLSLDYHLYKMVWTSQYIKMYLDNVEYYSFDISGGAAANLSEFHTPHFLLLNLAVGGQYTGIYSAAGITAPLPGKMYVDYIKLYQNPGDLLYFGNDHAASGNFGVLTETTPVSDSLTYGTNATLYYWNNLTNITSPAPVAYEGSRLWAVHANAGNWFGMGVDNNYINLNNFATGSLKFHFKSTYNGQYKMGLKTGHGETWINFAAGIQKYGLIRDGNWHQVTIPMADFNNPSMGMNLDLFSVKAAFMFAGDPASPAADFYFDNMYYAGGAAVNTPPTVAITSPVSNGIFTTPTSIIINADANDANGNVTGVDFYNGAILLGSDATSPYSFTWNNPPAGVDTFFAKATDNQGAVTTSTPVIVFVSAPGNTAPAASITSPANNAGFLTPVNITINANATDPGGSIYKVEFFRGATLMATSVTSPYSYTWNGATAGNYALTVKATDNGGLSATSSVVNISVANPIFPAVSITSPANNSSFAPPASITINADANDANGTVTKVEFYNGATLLAEDLTSPYSFTWNNVPLGNYTLTAKATDNDLNVTTSAPVAISVAPVPCTGIAVNGDYSYEVYTSAGRVYFKFKPLAPIAGCTSSILYLKQGGGGYAGYGMTASGGNFIYDRAIANGVITSFYFTYNTPPAGERNSSANPHGYIVGTVCAAGAPNATITSPTEAAGFTAPANIIINATASDLDGTVSKVAFYNGATLLGEDLVSPYSFTWTNVPAGAYALTAKATDNSAITGSSIPVNITVNNPNLNGYCGTAVSLDYEFKAETRGGIVIFTFHPLTPIAGCLSSAVFIREGSTGGYPGYNMTRSGTDFIFSKTIANGIATSFYFTYHTPPGGERNSSANPHSYTVGTNCVGLAGNAPSINFISPVANASYTESATIPIEINATDNDGTISKVEFYNGPAYLGMDDVSPYTFNWTNVPAGNYDLSAKATDNSSLFSTTIPLRTVVKIDNATGFCGTLANGDYSYKAETSGGNVTFTFHPLTPILGCNLAIIYIREGPSGGYPGYTMTAVGPDFRFTKAIASGVVCSIYFTYNVPSGGERNSSATPHSYQAGSVCLSGLPVSLLSFAATLQADGIVAIKWATATEQNNDHFLIEKSIDGRTFTTIAKVAGSNNSSVIKNYSAQDVLPVSGLNYYRLTQVDKDGKSTSYGIKTVNILQKKGGISVYPNPLKGTEVNIILAKPAAGKLNFQLRSIDGKRICNSSLMPQANMLKAVLPVKPAAGIYMLTVEGYAPVKIVVNE